MSSYCTIHDTKMFPSKFQEGEFYHFTGELTAEGKKISCKGEGLGKAVRNGHAEDGQFNHQVTAPTPEVKEITREPIKEPDWDEIAKGKVRHGVAIAFIENGRTFNAQTKKEMSKWIEWIMLGK